MAIVSCSSGVLVAHHQKQFSVGEALTERGIDHFIPIVERLRIVRGRHIREMRPLLSEYILIAISSTWKSLLSIKDVRGIMLCESGLYPAQVLPSEMDALRAMCDGNVFRAAPTEVRRFSYGQKVTPKSGAFANHVGRYDGIGRKQMDTAKFTLFGREQRVTFEEGELEAVDGNTPLDVKPKHNAGRWQGGRKNAVIAAT